MKKLILIPVYVILFSGMALAQGLSLPPSGDNQKAAVSQWIGLVEVSIHYNSPDVHGPNGEDRKGKIWGEVVHFGYIDQGYGTSKAAPWRAGANENTTITFSHDVVIGGKPVKAGTYGLFLAVEKTGPWTWILSRDAKSWGSYFYNPEMDVVRVETTPRECEYTEWLTFGFDNRQRNKATAYLQWENKRAGFTIEVPHTNELYLAAVRDELKGTTIGFTQQAYLDAVSFCVANNVGLEDGLRWAEQAISDPFIGRTTFTSLSAKAQVLTAMGNHTEAQQVMDAAIKHPTATIVDVHQYGRSLLAAGKHEKAMEVFKMNAKNHPEDKFTPNVGLARGYAAMGDKKNAVKYWELAIKNIPDNQKQNLQFYEGELKKLKGGT